MHVVPRPQPSIYPHLNVPEDLPAALAKVAKAHADASRAVREAREAYLDSLPGGSGFLAADEKAMLAMLAEEPSRYAAWWAASRKRAAAVDAFVRAITPELVEEADRHRLTVLADLEIALATAADQEWDEDAAGRLARAEVEMQAERLRQDYWSAVNVLAFLRDPQRWRRSAVGKPGDRSGWPADLSDEAVKGAQVLTGAEWRTVVSGVRR